VVFRWLSAPILELELELIQSQMAQKPMTRAEVYARALRASQNVKGAGDWVGARCALRVGGAWASAGVEGNPQGTGAPRYATKKRRDCSLY
jgi:hypothetical protein